MDIFLTILAFAWIFLASINDLKKREVYNWLNFSLIIFALSYRAIYSVINFDFNFFIFGLAGFGIFVILGYAFYYARIFAGGDAKLLMALGAVLPVSSGIYENLILLLGFVLLLLLFGSLWGIGYSIYLLSGNYKTFSKEFKKTMKKSKKLFFYSFLASVLIVVGILALRFDYPAIVFPALLLAFPFIYGYSKAIENSCMIISVSPDKISVGDWLYSPVKVNGKTIKPNWEGLSKKEAEIIKRYGKKVKIKTGIPFVPAFFFAFIILVYLIYTGILFSFF